MTAPKFDGRLILQGVQISLSSLTKPTGEKKLPSGATIASTYTTDMVLDPNNPDHKKALSDIQDMALRAVKAKLGETADLDGHDVIDQQTGNTVRQRLHMPWKAGDAIIAKRKAQGKDAANLSHLAGRFSVTASTVAERGQPPALGMLVNDQVKTEGLTESDFYAGCVCNVEVNVQCYAPIGQNALGGVKLYLNAVLRTGDGERWSGRSDKEVLAGLAGKTTMANVGQGVPETNALPL